MQQGFQTNPYSWNRTGSNREADHEKVEHRSTINLSTESKSLDSHYHVIIINYYSYLYLAATMASWITLMALSYKSRDNSQKQE